MESASGVIWTLFVVVLMRATESTPKYMYDRNIGADGYAYTLNYKGAEAFCQSKYGTSLATINTAEEYAEGRAICTSTYDGCWVGLNNQQIGESNAMWIFMDGSDVFPFANEQITDRGSSRCAYYQSMNQYKGRNGRGSFAITGCMSYKNFPLCNAPGRTPDIYYDSFKKVSAQLLRINHKAGIAAAQSMTFEDVQKEVDMNAKEVNILLVVVCCLVAFIFAVCVFLACKYSKPSRQKNYSKRERVLTEIVNEAENDEEEDEEIAVEVETTQITSN